ncbi:MAG: hypothetical protein AAGI48_03870 [Verrucomicrobiota bacterium]
MINELIAQAEAVSHSDIGKWISILLFLLPLLTAAGFLAGRKRTVTMEPNLMRVKMEEDFVTRREFSDLRNEIRGDVREMKGMWRECLTEIKNRDETTAEKIEKVASQAYEGRKGIHRTLNDTRERLKSVEDRMPKG